MINNKIKKFLPSPIVKILRTAYNNIESLQCFITRSVRVHTYAGFPLKVYIFDHVSKIWYDHDWGRDEIDFLRKSKLKNGARVFDIGAHHCVVALILSRIVGETGTVIAAEMDKKHVKIAQINKANNKAKNLHIVQSAIGSKEEIVYFDKDQVVVNSHKKHARKVSVTTIDKLSERYGVPSVVYIDVEGYECKVLEGGEKTMNNYPDYFIEVHVKHGLEEFNGSVSKLISYFPKNKYNFFMADPNKKNNFKPFDMKNELIKDRFYFVAIKKIKGNNGK